jgi:fructokinase
MRIGVDLGGTKIEAIAIDPAGRELARRRVPSPAHDYDAIVAAIAGLVADLEGALGADATVGVGIPGVTSPATGLVKNANTTVLIGRPCGWPTTPTASPCPRPPMAPPPARAPCSV